MMNDQCLIFIGNWIWDLGFGNWFILRFLSELAIIGSGDKVRQLTPEVEAFFNQNNIQFEVMITVNEYLIEYYYYLIKYVLLINAY